MAKQSKTSDPKTVTTTPNPPVEEADDLPIVTFLGMHKTPKGYVVIRIHTQGRRVVDEEVMTEGPVSRMEAENTLKVECVKNFIWAKDVA